MIKDTRVDVVQLVKRQWFEDTTYGFLVNAITNLTNVMSLAFINRSNANMTTAILAQHEQPNNKMLELTPTQ